MTPESIRDLELQTGRKMGAYAFFYAGWRFWFPGCGDDDRGIRYEGRDIQQVYGALAPEGKQEWEKDRAAIDRVWNSLCPRYLTDPAATLAAVEFLLQTRRITAEFRHIRGIWRIVLPLYDGPTIFESTSFPLVVCTSIIALPGPVSADPERKAA